MKLLDSVEELFRVDVVGHSRQHVLNSILTRRIPGYQPLQEIPSWHGAPSLRLRAFEEIASRTILVG